MAYLSVLMCFIDCRNHIPLAFPATRKALWGHKPFGDAITLVLPRVSISVTEQVLYLAYGQSRSAKVEQCSLCGEVRLEPDCSEITIFINQFQPGCIDRLPESSSSDDISIATQVSLSFDI